MARNQEETPAETTAEQGATNTEATTNAAPAKSGDERFSKIVLDEGAAKLYAVDGVEAGAVVNRKDFIVRLWGHGQMKRGDIKNEVNRLAAIEGNPTKAIAYQIVFQATKGVQGGPPAAAAPTGEQAQAPAEGAAE